MRAALWILIFSRILDEEIFQSIEAKSVREHEKNRIEFCPKYWFIDIQRDDKIYTIFLNDMWRKIRRPGSWKVFLPSINRKTVRNLNRFWVFSSVPWLSKYDKAIEAWFPWNTHNTLSSFFISFVLPKVERNLWDTMVKKQSLNKCKQIDYNIMLNSKYRKFEIPEQLTCSNCVFSAGEP